ncbi:MAG: response regulator [Deltaproteobacteria bacterium]|nr:response regulator [Deltaproteobacteria bacterium]
MKILVIEDQPTEMKLAQQVLRAAGHAVGAAEAAEQAAEAIKADRPQIILLDMVLPGMDGLTLVRKLKTDPETRDIPIVAVTSYPEKYPKGELLAAGCDAYFSKPLSPRSLPQELTEIVERGTTAACLATRIHHEHPHR